ncbi:MAG TPA: hypothetical protein EYP14_18265, partial [Planctomycetaceae bacterium]|nr:hypothetical protein [Planctomycetaceae bacterium]
MRPATKKHGSGAAMRATVVVRKGKAKGGRAGIGLMHMPAVGPIRGLAMLMVLAMLAVAVSVSFAMIRSALVEELLTSRRSSDFEARQAADTGASLALKRLAADPGWIPDPNPLTGSLGNDRSFSVEVQISDEGRGRQIRSVGQVGGEGGEGKAVERTLLVALTKQPTDVQPQAAIMAFRGSGVGVRLRANMRVDGDVWARSTVKIQQGVQLDGQVRERAQFGLGWSEVKPHKLTRYWTPGGDEYHSYDLAAIGPGNGVGDGYGSGNGADDDFEGDGDDGEGDGEGQSTITLRNIVLGPGSDNPRGVYFFDGTIVLENNVLLEGTLVATGNIIISGSDIHLAVVVPAGGSGTGDPAGS